MNKKSNKGVSNNPELRAIDKYFNTLDVQFGSGNKILYAIFLALAFFGIMGLIWMIPFPQFDFLVNMKMHTFLNWGSFFIAVVIYSYLKLAPTLSYAILFSIAIMSYFIVQLEYVERDGGPTVILVCSILTVISMLALYLLTKKERNITGKEFINFLTLGPVWLWSKLFQKLKVKY